MNEKKESKTEENALMSMELDGDGMQDKTMRQKVAKLDLMLKAGMLPTRFKDVSQVIAAQQYASELGLTGLVSLRQIAVVQGNPTVFGDLPLALVKKSGKLTHMKECFIDEAGVELCLLNKNLNKPVFGAVCFTQREGGNERETFFTLAEAKTAGLVDRSDVWKKYPKIMLKYRCRSENLKDNFPDVLNGLAIGEYDFDATTDRDAINYGAPKESELNDKIKNIVECEDISKKTPTEVATEKKKKKSEEAGEKKKEQALTMIKEEKNEQHSNRDKEPCGRNDKECEKAEETSPASAGLGISNRASERDGEERNKKCEDSHDTDSKREEVPCVIDDGGVADFADFVIPFGKDAGKSLREIDRESLRIKSGILAGMIERGDKSDHARTTMEALKKYLGE